MSRYLVRMLPILLLPALALFVPGGAPPVAAQDTGSISGRVIHDLDGDGDTLNEDEPGLAGWHLRLEMNAENGESPIVRETRTDRSGRYFFRRLPPGNYSISIPCKGQPSLWLSTAPNEDGSFGATVEAGEDMDGIDFWLSLLRAPPPHDGSIVGRVVWDENRDGVPDPSEPGAAGWQVNVDQGGSRCFPQDGQVTYAASDGSFHFTGLQPRGYCLSYPGPSGLPHPDYVFDSPGISEQTEEGYEYFNFSPGVEVPAGGTGSIAIGILDLSGTGSISGEIYADSNENGLHDADEPLVDCGCWMGLMYRTPGGYAPVVSRITSSSRGGVYAFSGLRGGDYWVALLQPPGTPTSPPASPLGYSFHLVTLKDGEELANIDFGLRVQPGQPTRIPQPMPASTPVPHVDLVAPVTGAGGASSDSGLAGPAAALAVAGALAVSGSALVCRRQARVRRGDGGEKHP